MTSDEWSDREHIHAPRGPLLIAAYGRVLPSVGIYRGYGELMRALLDGRCLPRSRTPANEVVRRRMLMAVVEDHTLEATYRRRIALAVDSPGVEQWLLQLQKAGVLSLLVLGRERI